MPDTRRLTLDTIITIRAENLDQDPSWRDFRECSPSDAHLFFHENRLSETYAAKAICKGCDVRLNCLVFALDTAQPVGIWGARTTKERTQLIRRLNRERRKRG